MGDSILVLGIGNVLWADEGFGVRAVAALHEGWSFPPEVRLLDGGTQGLYLLGEIQGIDRILVFDAIDYKLEPGKMLVLRDAEIPAYLATGKMSPHQTSFQEVLALAQLTGWKPKAVTLVGVQPLELRDFGGTLTPVVKAAMPGALEQGLAQLAQWGVPIVPRESKRDDLLGESLSLDAYETGRPTERDAFRKGDPRIAVRAEDLG